MTAARPARGPGGGGVSVVLLTLNEEIHIRRALASVAWSDNVVVVDSFSTDRTEVICREFPNVTFVQRAFTNFAEQRQFAIDEGLIRHPWVLALDADEVVPDDLAEELAVLAAETCEGGPVAFDIPMRFYFWGRWLRRSTAYPTWWRRFFRRDRCRCVQRGHGDGLEVDGAVGRMTCDLVHWNLKGLSDWLEKHNRYSSDEADYALKELKDVPLGDLFARDRARRRLAQKRVFRALPFPGLLRFVQLYVFHLGFLDGWRGFHFCRLRGMHHDIVRLKIREARLNAAADAGRTSGATEDA